MGVNVYPTPSSSQAKKTQTITSSTTWTVPSGVTSVNVTCIGAAASIGGAGAVITRLIDTSSIQGTGISVTIGAANSPNSYGKAGDTSFGSYITAGGGFSGASGFAGMSGTRYISGISIPASSSFVPYFSDYTSGDENMPVGIVYNSTAALWLMGGTVVNSASNIIGYYTSANGTTWTRRTVTISGASGSLNNVTGAYSANNRFFIFYKNTSNYPYYITSTDGISWSGARAIPINTASFVADYAGVMYSSTSAKYYFGSYWNGYYAAIISSVAAANVATTDPGGEVYLSDGASGFITTRLLTNGSNLGVCFAYASTGATIQKSTFNGTSWTTFAQDTNFSVSAYPTSGAWDGTKFTVCTNTGRIWTSTTGSTWTDSTVTVSGLFITGWNGTYYYGHINNALAYSTNGTTWTSVGVKGSGSNQAPNKLAANGNELLIGTNTAGHGMLERFNITTPNTTIASGYTGQVAGTGSGNVFAHGGAGGPGSIESTYGSFYNYVNRKDAEGINGYGQAINSGSAIGVPGTYGSTNGFVGAQGAVILEWEQ